MKYFLIILVLFIIKDTQSQTPLDGGFTYQGSLRFNNAPANGDYDFIFKLYDNLSIGNQIGNDVLADDVTVVDGVFTTIIDFNTPAFMGDKVWLEISVRPGAEVGGFQQLLPRQQITSTPYAIHAQFVGADAVSSLEIQNGSITTIDLANDSISADKIAVGAVGSNEIASGSVGTVAIIDNAVSNAKIASDAVTKDKIGINSVGTTEIISSQIQRRIGSTCSSGFYINAVNEDGSVVCAEDQSGGATNVTSADIVDGTIATVDLANNSITSAKITDGTITISDIASNSIDTLSVIDDSLTSADILNGTISTVDLANNSVTFDKIVDGSVGAGKVISNQVQLRINGSCSSGDFVESVNEDGTVNCATTGMVNGADIVDGTIVAAKLANSSVTTDKIELAAVNGFNIASATITASNLANNSVNTNSIEDNSIISADIFDGAITSSDLANDSVTSLNILDNTIGTNDILDGSIDSLDLAINSVTSSKILNNAVGADKIISSQVQKRVSSTCNIGYYLRGINEDGTVMCQRLPLGLNYILDTSSDVGRYNSMAIGSDNKPIISYYDAFNEDLKVVKCTTLTCSSVNTPVVLDSIGNVGRSTSLEIGSDNNPVISYYDVDNTDLKLVKCTTIDCSVFGTPIILDSTGDVGSDSSIAIGVDNNPVISYYDQTNGNLKVVKCTTPSCSSFNTPIVLDSTGDVGFYNSIAIDTHNNPIISYYDQTNGSLKVVQCTNTLCSTFNTPITLDSIDNVGIDTSIAIALDNNPIISYYDQTNGNLKVIKCDIDTCSSFDTIVLDFTDNVGLSTNIAIGSDNKPIISYYDLTNQNLKVIKCTTADCSEFNTPVTLGADGDAGFFSSLAIGADNNPIISYYDFSNFDLKVYSCSDTQCRR